MEFIGRKKELGILKSQLESGHAAILLYGRRRLGKTWLLRQAMKDLDGAKILYTCKPMSLSDNATMLSARVLEAIGLAPLSFSSFEQLFDFISKRPEKFTIALDEYQDLKRRNDNDYVDSIFRDIVDSRGDNVSIVFCGSSIRMMKALMDADNPLFERFTREIHLKEMDYLECSAFYPHAGIRERIMLYSVFGGVPFLNSLIDSERSVEYNIIDLFVSETGNARTYVKNVLDAEVRSIPDAFTVLSIIGNGKRRYSEIESHMSDEKSRNQLSRTLESMQKADLIVKRRPINDTSRKNTFYEIASNPLRFYFAYLLEADDYMTVGDRSYFDSRIRPSFVTYVSYRFEEIARSWFSILSQSGKRPDVLRIGTYWYDDKVSRRSGEFDVALQTSEGYEIYECKFLENKAPLSLVQEEKRKAMAAGGLAVTRFGMISSSGFEENTDQAVLITGDDLYASCLKI